MLLGGVNGLVSTISNYVKQNKNKGEAQRGIIDGGFVRIGNRAYPYTAVTDIKAENGDYVYCVITNNNVALIVGE